MRIWNKSGLVGAVAVVLFGLSGLSWASSVPMGLHAGMTKSAVRSGARRARMAAVVASVNAAAASLSQQFSLRLNNLHTGESLDVVYRVGNTYIPDALEKLNYFLRDHNTQDVSDYDPKEFDVLDRKA